MFFRRICLMAIGIIMAGALPPQAWATGKDTVKPSQQWRGAVADLSLREAVPQVILTSKGLENLWKVWKAPGPLPKVDFSGNW